MSLISLRDVSVHYGAQPLLEQANLHIEPGERVCLVGRNGTGKSTLMKLLAGEIELDGGEISRRQGLQVATLEQEVPGALDGTVFDVVSDGLGELAPLIEDYHRVSREISQGASTQALTRLDALQNELEARGGWQLEQRVEQTLSRLSLDGDVPFASLSGGLKRRVLLARAIVPEPDLLLLDEPTNHLDIDSIRWLEDFLLSYPRTLMLVTHDRMLADRLATRIVELDRGRLTSWDGGLREYLRRKQEILEAEAKANAEFDRKLAREETWIRQGIKARRTRNEGRVRALESMRDRRRERRSAPGKARIQMQEAERSGKLVVEAEGVAFRYGEQPVFTDLSTTILRGDRVGIIGPNGCGKSTLLNILLGRLPPTEGRLRLGTKIEVAYFDQYRAQLDPAKSVQDNVAEGSERITVNGASRHVVGYLQDFLFTPERVRSPVSTLSGGERNRLLLARLFSKPSNLLVLDEPTNDLDVETLELLEERLADYGGTVLLVSHDRSFLNNVVTSTLVFEQGRVNEYVGGYDDWLRQSAERADAATVNDRRPPAERRRPATPVPRKLSYKQQKELEALPARIEALESEQSGLHARLSDPAFYRGEGESVLEAKTRLEHIESELIEAYEQWEKLEAMS